MEDVSSIVPWKNFVPETDIQRYERIGFGGVVGIGTRPALIIIDVQKRTVLSKYPASCAETAPAAVERIAELLRAARDARMTIVHAFVAPKNEHSSERFASKFGVLSSVEQEGYEFVDEVLPLPDEILLPKDHPSAFFGTALTSYLIERHIDSLILAGATTSGCIRATAVDAFSLGYRTSVASDAVFDRVVASHAVNLFDMNYKYADVRPVADIVTRLSRPTDSEQAQ